MQKFPSRFFSFLFYFLALGVYVIDFVGNVHNNAVSGSIFLLIGIFAAFIETTIQQHDKRIKQLEDSISKKSSSSS